MDDFSQGGALYHGDCLHVLPRLPDSVFDVVLTDPPYPEAARSYGHWSEAEWLEMMQTLTPHLKRVLKPQGSAVLILQANSRALGSMRPWLWQYLVWCCRTWNVVQDAYWWNYAALPEAHAIQGKLLRPSLKYCVWLGAPDCHRRQDQVMWTESQRNVQIRLTYRAKGKRTHRPSGHGTNDYQAVRAALEAGGVTPFNVLPVPNTKAGGEANRYNHGAMTALEVCDWWLRYLAPDRGLILDPFAGTATTGVAAQALGLRFVGVEKEQGYFRAALERLQGG